VVYVADNNSTNKSIVGYRSGDNWYDANGNAINDPKIIAEAGNGQAPPWLSNPSDKAPYSNSAFTAYKPQINVMPRVAFSFPISDVANFFAHYDILTQRPPSTQSNEVYSGSNGIAGTPGATGTPYTSYNRTNPRDYYFLSSNQGAIVANGNLK